MATVTNTIKLPDGTAPPRASVEISLVASETVTASEAGWITATDVTILSTSRPTVTAGVWTADLTPNANITPSGTVYMVREFVGRDRYVHYINVGSGGGNLADLLTAAPGALASGPLAAHIADTVDAHDATAISHVAAGGIVATTVGAALAGLGGGASVSDATLKAWTTAEAFEATSITRDSNDVVTSATVAWPDGSAGTFTATTINATFTVIDAYTVSHTASGKTVTQTAVTRNSSGAVTTKPALTVA